MEFDQSILPHSPYSDMTGAIIQAFRPAYWASWMFLVDEDTSTNTTFMFKKGDIGLLVRAENIDGDSADLQITHCFSEFYESDGARSCGNSCTKSHVHKSHTYPAVGISWVKYIRISRILENSTVFSCFLFSSKTTP